MTFPEMEMAGRIITMRIFIDDLLAKSCPEMLGVKGGSDMWPEFAYVHNLFPVTYCNVEYFGLYSVLSPGGDGIKIIKPAHKLSKMYWKDYPYALLPGKN